jgi:hypothetical protein
MLPLNQVELQLPIILFSIAMYKEGYTILTGPVKHAPKGEQAVRKAEKAG